LIRRRSYIHDLQLARQVRNVYLLVNFGDFVDGSVNTTADPYVQLLSITDPTAAHADFVNVRLNGQHTNTTGAALHSRPPPRPIDVYNNNNSNGKTSKLAIIIVCSIGGALVLLAIIVVYCSRDRFAKRGRGGLASTYQSYRNLNAPAPAGDMHHVQGYRGHGSAPMYTDPWGRR
jgi:hypothetical protein